jgi:ribonuclease BN (tRNA processing enzyme)
MLRIAATSVTALWITVLSAGGEQSEKSMTAHFIEVGQRHASLLEFPCGAMPIDAGAASAADNRLVEYLDDFFADRPDQHKTLDLVLITHNHIDHTQALMKAATRFQVKRFIDNGWTTGSRAPQTNALRQAVKTKSLKTEVRSVNHNAITSLPKKTGLTPPFIDSFACADIDPAGESSNRIEEQEPRLARKGVHRREQSLAGDAGRLRRRVAAVPWGCGGL